jgi:beta-phosphoglucomutase-like phosphatase (HAD superfamily)
MFDDFNKAVRGNAPKTIPLLLIFDLATLSDETGDVLVYEAKDLLRSLKRQGHILAVTSGEAQETCINALKQSRFLDFFEDRVYTPEGTNCLKRADPAFFQHILSDLKTSPNGAVAVELEPDGVDAASDAGLAVFAYADPRFAARIDARRRELERAGADIVVETLLDIDTLLTARSVQARLNRTPDGPGFTFD